MKHLAAALCLLTAVLGAGDLSAQTFPVKPLRLVVPYAPGGVVDFIGRAVGQRLSEQVGQSVVIENRPGAGGIIGIENVVKASPDGYSIVIMDPAIVVNVSLQPKVPYDMTRDVTTVSVIGSSPLVLVVNPQLPARDVKSLVDFGRSNPGKLNFASAGIGTTPHMAGEFFNLRSGAGMTHVPYKGMGLGMADLVSGQVQLAFSSITAALPFIREGRLRALATTGPRRSGALPDQPTMAEAGVSGFEVDLWLGIFAPSGLPAEVLARLNTEVRRTLESADVRVAAAKVGVEPRGTSVDEGTQFVRAELDKWSRVVREANLRPSN